MWAIRNATYVRSGEAQARTGFANCRRGAAIIRQSRFIELFFVLSYCEHCVISFASLPRNCAGTEQGSVQEYPCACRQNCVSSSGTEFLYLEVGMGGRPAAFRAGMKNKLAVKGRPIAGPAWIAGRSGRRVYPGSRCAVRPDA